jgi:hypothetical protein
VNGRRGWWLRLTILGGLLAATGCASAPKTPGTAEIAPIRLRNAQTGARERCGIEMIRDVERANDLTWSERLFYGGQATREARQAVQDEEQWRQRCVERYRQQGYEVVSTQPSR